MPRVRFRMRLCCLHGGRRRRSNGRSPGGYHHLSQQLFRWAASSKAIRQCCRSNYSVQFMDLGPEIWPSLDLDFILCIRSCIQNMDPQSCCHNTGRNPLFCRADTKVFIFFLIAEKLSPQLYSYMPPAFGPVLLIAP